jgi:hypothetical protein
MLRFASENDALQYLADITDSKIIISALRSSDIDKDDYVILLNPRVDFYQVFKFPGSNVSEYHKDDLVKDMRKDGSKGRDLVFPGSMDPSKVAEEVSNMAAGLSVAERRNLKAEDMRGIYIGDLLASDKEDSRGSNTYEIDFKTDRKYTGIGSIGTMKTVESVQEEKERMLKEISKNPDKYREMVEKDLINVDEVTKQELMDIFGTGEGYTPGKKMKEEDLFKKENKPSSSKPRRKKQRLSPMAFETTADAIQYLADITDTKIVIK